MMTSPQFHVLALKLPAAEVAAVLPPPLPPLPSRRAAAPSCRPGAGPTPRGEPVWRRESSSAQIYTQHLHPKYGWGLLGVGGCVSLPVVDGRMLKCKARLLPNASLSSGSDKIPVLASL